MYRVCAALPLCAVLCAAPPPAPPAAPPCAQLAARYAARYSTLTGDSTGRAFRPLETARGPAQVSVWGGGGAGGAGAAAAAALLHAALRYGLGYDAALRRQAFDICSANISEFAVAAAAPFRRCAADDDNFKLAALSGGPAGVPLAPPPPLASLPAARPAPPPAPLPAPLTARDPAALRASRVLTQRDFELLSPNLPPCEGPRVACSADEAAPAVLADARVVPAELRERLCNAQLPLRFLIFEDVTCFDRTLGYLQSANASFVFLDRDWIARADLPALAPVRLRECAAAADDCPARDLNALTEAAFRIGDGSQMRKYSPQIADVVTSFCPRLAHLGEVASDADDIEISACKWALRNRNTFESWITSIRHKYVMYIFVCTGDPLNSEYNKTVEEVERAEAKYEFDFSTRMEEVDCEDPKSMHDRLSDVIRDGGTSLMGAVAWSAAAGAARAARLAARRRVPLVLAGRVAQPSAGAADYATAAAAAPRHLAAAYRSFLERCEWSRVAILSDGSADATHFSDSLLADGGVIAVDKTVTTDTVSGVLESLRRDDARVFIVNANSTIAEEILLTAIRLGMTPPRCAWILREWSPAGARVAAADWGAMSHYTLGAAPLGPADGGAGARAGGDGALRERLRALWPGAAWPPLAASLADAMLVLFHSFAAFNRLYSTNSHKHSEYAMKFSQIFEKITVAGVTTEFRIANGTIENPLVYLERWRGPVGAAVGAWRARDGPASADRAAWCVSRVRDRPHCVLPAAGARAAFVRRCLDGPLGALLAALALLPAALLLARRARLRRLARRDLGLLARIFEDKLTATVVPRDSLRIHKEIGAGNYGSVYLATLRSRGKSHTVAAKALRDDADKEDYLREARTLQLLDHDNIVKFVGVCFSGGSLLLLMEYAYYGDLQHYLATRRHLAGPKRAAAGEGVDGDAGEAVEAAHVSSEALTRLAREAAAALHHVAACGLVHRDVRAANCLVDRRRTLKLADFGLARRVAGVGAGAEYTSARHALFPVLWMAPESLERGTFSSASDVWALGVLCLELATLGCRPYGTGAPHRVLAYVRAGGHPPLPPDLADPTRLLVLACWQRQAEARPSALEVARFLAREPRALRPALLPAPPLPPPAPIAHDTGRLSLV